MLLKQIYLEINDLYNQFKMCSSFSYLAEYNHLISNNHLIKNISQAQEFKKVVDLLYQEGTVNNFLNLSIYNPIKKISFKLNYFLNYLCVYYAEIKDKSNYIKVTSLINLAIIIKFEYKDYLISQTKLNDLLNDFEKLDLNKVYKNLDSSIETFIREISTVLIKNDQIRNDSDKLNNLYNYLEILKFITII
ncbi:hypothetical protein [Mycoplasma putrefaciens]|uniref:Uncharacterized protein n=1 Tax=Mycoplasma putrefaciens Mput9231 TaxID=1292033 RepID=M9WGJ9_9MOLU|nr:hypothetical protein [Mycoplasma putrefaciens]AGJ90509.1 Hypothetical protein MPUT9231_0530 [Mycoplasma putrefaciens Mput9231]